MPLSEELAVDCTTLSEEPRFIRKALFEEQRYRTASTKTEELLSQCMRYTKEDLDKKACTCSSEEEEQVSLRRLVGMQQRQLAEMQQQLQSIQILVANLVSSKSSNSMQAGNDTTFDSGCEQLPAAGPLEAKGDGIGNRSSQSNSSRSTGTHTCTKMPAVQPMTRDVGVCVGESLVGFPVDALYPQRPSRRDAAVDTSLDFAEASTTEENVVVRQQSIIATAACCASQRAFVEQERACVVHGMFNERSDKPELQVDPMSSDNTSVAEVTNENAGGTIVHGIASVEKERVSTVIVPRVSRNITNTASAVPAPQDERSTGVTFKDVMVTTAEVRSSPHLPSPVLANSAATAFKDVMVSSTELCGSPRLSTSALASDALETASKKVAVAADMDNAALATTQSSGPWAGAGVAALDSQSAVRSEPSGDEGCSTSNLKASLQSHDGPLGLLAEAVNVATGLPSCLRDSADTAGGATPPIRTAGAGFQENVISWEDLGPDSVPRICWPSSPLESDSDSDLDEQAVASDFGSVECSSVLGLHLGLPQLPCTGTVGGPMAMPAGPLRMAF